MSGLIQYKTPVPVTYSDTPMFDAFGRLRTSTPQTLFDSKLLLNSAPHLWSDQETSGSGTTSTYSTFRASVTLAVSASTAGTRVRQSKRWLDYQPGKSQLVLATFVMNAAATGITRRVGFFNTNTGVFLQQTAADLRFVIRSQVSGSPVDTNSATQSQWNIDKMDGSGPSGVTLDITKSQIMFIDIEWLGVGRVKVGFVINGLYVLCHQFLNANINASVYMSSPNAPIRYEISNDGSGGAASLECICSTVASEGGRQDLGFDRAISRQTIPVVTGNNTNVYPIFAIRLNGSYLGAHVHLLKLAMICTSTTAFNWYLIENPAVVGGSLNFVSIPNSAVQADYQSTGTLTVNIESGTLISSGVSISNQAEVIAQEDTVLGSFVNGTSDIWVLAIQRVTGGSETFYGALNWRETGA